MKRVQNSRKSRIAVQETRKAQKPGRKTSVRRSGWWKWTVGLGALALVGYGVSQMPNVPYTARDIPVVDFSALSRKEKTTALQAANRTRCTCTCGMTLAQCVATDTTCPVRSDNVDKIRRMVEQAKESRPTS